MITKQKIKKIIIIVSIMAVLSLLCVFYAFINPFVIRTFSNKFNIVSNKNNMLVHFINVDQADATAINLPDGKIMLIDAGSEEFNVTYTKYLTENVLNTSKDKVIDYLILTHADLDHIGGSLRLLKNFKINKIFMPKIESNSKHYQEILKIVENNYNYEILNEAYSINENGYIISFLDQLSSNNTNDSSQVVKLEYRESSFLFVGDISYSVEDDYILEYDKYLDVDVLKVAHHGSNESSTDEFLKVVSPKYSVISCGKYNQYGHPREEVLQRLNNINSKVLRTDKDGNILFVVGKNYNLKYLTGEYYITSLNLNYTYFILVVEVILFVSVIIVIIKKEKVNKHIHT